MKKVIEEKCPKFDKNCDPHTQKSQLTINRIHTNPYLDTSWLSRLNLTSENLENREVTYLAQLTLNMLISHKNL